MVKKICLVCCAVLFSMIATAQRVAEPLNRAWSYNMGDDLAASAIGYDDSHWQVIGLPHSFSIPYFLSKDFYVGYGWYRKHLSLKKTSKECFFLEFDGVFQEAEVYVNGKRAVHHVGGYTAFNVDITPYVKSGDNVIAVRVNNKWQPTVAPRGGEHVFSGGIYRGVRLVRKSAVAHICWQGVTITTPTLEKNQGKSFTVMMDSVPSPSAPIMQDALWLRLFAMA